MQSEKEGTLFNENAGYVPDASYFRNPSLTSYMPVRIFTETGCVKKHKDEFARLGKKALIVVTGMYAAEKSGALNDVCGSLDALGIPWEIFDRINPNPALTDCMCAAETAVKAGCDFVVGIGGGSALDAAKCIAVLAANPGMSQTELYSLSWPVKPLPVAAVGTTAGTGSEVTKVSVITVPEGRKKSFHHEDVFPAAAFGDASYTVSLPLDITFSTAIDALSHAVESYFSRNANSISRCYSVQAVKMLFPMLKILIRHRASGSAPENIPFEVRQTLYLASLYGGLAINITGTCLPHTMGYLITEKHGLPHGFACTIFLPEFLKINEAVVPQLSEGFYRETGMGKEELLSVIDAMLEGIHVTVGEEEIKKEHGRWIDNSSIKKGWGSITADQCDDILRSLGSSAPGIS